MKTHPKATYRFSQLTFHRDSIEPLKDSDRFRAVTSLLDGRPIQERGHGAGGRFTSHKSQSVNPRQSGNTSKSH